MNRRARPEHPDLFDQWDRIEARVNPPVAPEISAQNRALEHERQAGRGGRRRQGWCRNRQRLADIQKLIHHRHGGPCDTDEGDTYLSAAMPHLLRLHAGPDLETKVTAWARCWLPRLNQDHVADRVELALDADPRLLSADALASLLCVPHIERTALDLRTIGATDFGRAERAAERRRKNIAYHAAKRLKAGATPRSESKVAKAKALGVSLSTYKRQLKRDAAAMMMLDPISTAVGSRLRTAQVEPISTTIDRRSSYRRQNGSLAPERAAEGPARTARPSPVVGAGGHSPSDKVRAVPLGHAVPLPLPAGGVSEHPDMIGGFQHLGDVLLGYVGGIMHPDLARAVREAQRVRMMTQDALARQIGISRPQLANALQGRFGLSRSAATNLMRWLAAA